MLRCRVRYTSYISIFAATYIFLITYDQQSYVTLFIRIETDGYGLHYCRGNLCWILGHQLDEVLQLHLQQFVLLILVINISVLITMYVLNINPYGSSKWFSLYLSIITETNPLMHNNYFFFVINLISLRNSKNVLATSDTTSFKIG